MRSTRLKVIVPLLTAAVALTLLTGCNVGPKYKRPAYQAPEAFRGADESQVVTNTQASLGDKTWPEVFQEPELQALIKEAVGNSFDVRIAAQRILEQQAQVKVTRAGQFPQITAGGNGIGADIPSSLGNISSPLAFGGLNLGISWVPDFWGLYRKQTDVQRAKLLNQVWAERAVRVILVQQITTSYLQLRALDRELEITKQTVKAREESLKLTSTLTNAGSAPLSDQRQAEQLLYTATAQVPQLEQQIAQQENSLSILLGRNPGPIARHADNVLAPRPQDVPVGMPSQLLERRPDIQEAETQLIAANAQIGIARAQFFPQLTITGSAGVGGDSLSNIFSTDSRTIYGIGQLSQPLFMGGKLRGQLQLSQEQQKELIISYQQTIAGALRDVSNALIAMNKTKASREQQQKLVASAEDSVRLARMRYQGGSTAYLEVLTNDTNLYNAQLNLVTAQQNEALTLVQLYAALGGGWK